MCRPDPLKIAIVLFSLLHNISSYADQTPLFGEQARQTAERINSVAQTRLAPVYPALADWLVKRYDLRDTHGIGVDLGGGTGNLIRELCARTEHIFWINADINPFVFSYMYASAIETGMEHRIGAVFADAHTMPFKDNYANIVVSRGTFQFWHDKPIAFKEIYRILKPGGIAVIGRGYTGNLDPAIAAQIRKVQGDGGPKYDIAETAAELQIIMEEIGITDYKIIIPKNDKHPDLKYGIWLEFKKSRE